MVRVLLLPLEALSATVHGLLRLLLTKVNAVLFFPISIFSTVLKLLWLPLKHIFSLRLTFQEGGGIALSGLFRIARSLSLISLITLCLLRLFHSQIQHKFKRMVCRGKTPHNQCTRAVKLSGVRAIPKKLPWSFSPTGGMPAVVVTCQNQEGALEHINGQIKKVCKLWYVEKGYKVARDGLDGVRSVGTLGTGAFLGAGTITARNWSWAKRHELFQTNHEMLVKHRDRVANVFVGRKSYCSHCRGNSWKGEIGNMKKMSLKQFTEDMQQVFTEGGEVIEEIGEAGDG